MSPRSTQPSDRIGLRVLVLAAPVLAALVSSGCAMWRGIPGLLGVTWGDDAAVASERIGVTCKEWETWAGGQGVEVCFDIDHPVQAFGEAALVSILRRGARVVGLQLRYPACGVDKWQSIRAAVAKDLDVHSTEATIYTVYGDGSVLHVARDGRDATCTVTTGGADFARAFQAYLLKQGLGELVKLRAR